MRKAYRSTNPVDQGSLVRSTMPPVMMALYDQCDPPPALDMLDKFRPEQKKAMTMYTDPSYFFELWKKEIFKEVGIDKKIQKNKAHQTAHVQPQRRKVESTATIQHNSRVLLSHYADHSSLHNNSGNLMHFPTEYHVSLVVVKLADSALDL